LIPAPRRALVGVLPVAAADVRLAIAPGDIESIDNLRLAPEDCGSDVGICDVAVGAGHRPCPSPRLPPSAAAISRALISHPLSAGWRQAVASSRQLQGFCPQASGHRVFPCRSTDTPGMAATEKVSSLRRSVEGIAKPTASKFRLGLGVGTACGRASERRHGHLPCRPYTPELRFIGSAPFRRRRTVSCEPAGETGYTLLPTAVQCQILIMSVGGVES